MLAGFGDGMLALAFDWLVWCFGLVFEGDNNESRPYPDGLGWAGWSQFDAAISNEDDVSTWLYFTASPHTVYHQQR